MTTPSLRTRGNFRGAVFSRAGGSGIWSHEKQCFLASRAVFVNGEGFMIQRKGSPCSIGACSCNSASDMSFLRCTTRLRKVPGIGSVCLNVPDHTFPNSYNNPLTCSICFLCISVNLSSALNAHLFGAFAVSDGIKVRHRMGVVGHATEVWKLIMLLYCRLCSCGHCGALLVARGIVFHTHQLLYIGKASDSYSYFASYLHGYHSQVCKILLGLHRDTTTNVLQLSNGGLINVCFTGVLQMVRRLDQKAW